MTGQQIQRDLQTLDATVATWTETHKTLSRRVTMTEEVDDRQDGALTDLAGRVADLEDRAVFAQRLTGETVTIIVHVSTADYEQAMLALMRKQLLGRLVFEILR